MKEYNHKITKGSPIRGDQLRIARAKAIFKAAMGHPYARDIQCYVNGKDDVIIKMCLTHLEIPDEPVYEICDEEENVANNIIEYVCLMWHLPIYAHSLMHMIL